MAEDPSFVSSAQSPPHIYRPIPRRNFTTHLNSEDSPGDPYPQSTPPPPLHDASSRGSDFLAQLNARLLRTYNAGNGALDGDAPTPPRNKSLLNLTGSTLYGIYDDVGSAIADERSVAETPWGTGAETPAHSGMGLGGWESGMRNADSGPKTKPLARRRNTHGPSRLPISTSKPKSQRQGSWKYAITFGKISALFSFGVAYGVVVSHLHDTRELAAVRVGEADRGSSTYLASWGLAGVVLGCLLPYVDLLWNGEDRDERQPERDPDKESDSSFSEQWNDVVRSVGAFMGIAFAIRRLPWQSTLQLTITLALVNPALWYILDRSKPGLSFSLIATSILTSFIFLSNPNVLPSPSLPATTNSTHIPSNAKAHANQELFAGVVSYESLAIVTWVGSVLFCSCVCFGSIGRRLAVLDSKK